MRNFGTVRFLKFGNFFNTFGKNVFFTFLKSFTILSGENQKSWAFLELSHSKLSPCGMLEMSRQLAIIRFFQNRFEFLNFSIFVKIIWLDSVLEKSDYCKLPAHFQHSTW